MPVIDKNIKVLSVKELEQNYNVYANETISGLLRKPIQKGSDGHYTYEQYEQMKNNAEGITRAISDAYSQGYIGVMFPKQHYLLCSVVYEGGTDAGLTNDLIWILNIANFLVDFNNSTIQLCVDTTADWVITDGPSQEEYTNKIDNARLNAINNGNIRCTFKLERRCKNKNNDTVHGLAIINRSIALQSPYSDPNDATSTRDDESGYQSTLAEAIKYAQRHCNGTIITIKQCHHVTVQNVKLLGDCYTRTYSDDLDHRKLEAKIEDSTGLNISGFVTDHITIKNIDASGFTADGLSTGAKSPFYYARPLTADQRRQIVNGANRDGYEALTGNSYFTVTGLLGNTVYYTRRYPSENNVGGTTNVEPLGGTIEVKSSNSDKKRRAIGRIYNRPADKLLAGNYNELVKEQLSKLLFSIESPGGNTRRTRCYPSVEIITYKKFGSENDFRNFVGIDSGTETLAWFQETGQNCGRYANESIYSTTYYRHVNSSAYGDILVEYNKITDSNGTTNKDITGYYIAGRIIECEFKESFHLYPDEKYFRIQTLYEQLGEDNLDLYLDGEGQTKKRVPYLSIWTPPCSDVIIDSCYFHDNLRGHCALGSNNTSIFRSVFDKFASCNIYINNIMGMYPRRYGTTDYSIDIEDSFANKLVIEDCVFKAFPGRDVKPLGDLMFPGLLRLIFNRNLCYNCMPYGSGLYEAIITNNVFYHTAVFFDNATPAEDRFGKDVWRNVVFQNNTYYDARIHSIVTKNRNNRIRIVDCYIDVRENHPESDTIVNASHNKEIFNDNYDNGDVEFINCTLNLADNGNANAFLGTLTNCKINGGKGWRAKSINGGEISNTYVSFFPTNRNCVSKGGKLYISVEAKGVKGMTLATNIYEEYWFNSLTTVEGNTYNSFVIDLYFKDCEMQLINKYFEYGVGPGKRIQGSDDYQRTSIENITYHFDNCRFIRENYNIGEEYPLLSNSNNVTMIFNNCDFSAAYAQYEYNVGEQVVTKQCLAYKGIKDSGGSTYTSGILTTVFNNCIIPENTYFDTSSDTVITNNS